MDQTTRRDNLSSYYSPTHHAAVAASPTNGLLPPPPSSAAIPDMVYPHSAPSAAASTPLESTKRKRGRPRKYGTPEQALAAKRATASSQKERKEQQQGFGGSSSSPHSSSYSGPSYRKSQLSGNAGQGFAPHVIGIAAGEDVAQKIILFVQQSKREICILSASGSISSVSLRQPATAGGNVTYEGCFDIVTLSGSYVRTESGGKTGGLSICLSDTGGQIIGGGVGGPLIAGGPVQVILGSFSVGSKKETTTCIKDDPSMRLPSPVGALPASSGGFRVVGMDSSSPSHYMVQTGARM
ncbi:hypothetical protein SAY86_003188 [Trapa natans]|uniref:AT-hook motif nuclear-localized protein n=1 Tax=Trapa natans TaxID=22666 RepID=A0AAN7R063_TRANT|nr:hypothetical protein SAY86_003188 [Trapa natans]